MSERTLRICFAAAFVLLAPLALAAQETHKQSDKGHVESSAAIGLPERLWHDPGDIASLDLTYGSGGKDRAPADGAEFKFIKEDLDGTSTKLHVEDASGVKWLIKVGEEAQPETAATRFLWAMGYFTDTDYYVSTIHVTGLQHLRRESKSISADGAVVHARLKLETGAGKRIDYWSWFSNPFVGSKELNGLRVLMALIDNWDLKTVNNKIYQIDDTEKQYVVSDLGASFGKTGGVSSRSKGNLHDYRKAKFIDHRKANTVDFVMATRPFLLLAPINPPNFAERSHMEDVVKHIPRADAKWLGQQLSCLTHEQIISAFKSAGYSDDQADDYSHVLVERIAELNSL